MNKVMLLGRMVRDPEIKTTTTQVSVATFCLAVDRKFKNAAGERQADFINCVAWRQNADFLAKYFRKGSKMAVVGTLQTRSWTDNDNKKHTVTEVIVDEIHFAGEKKSQDAAPFYPPAGMDAPADPANAPMNDPGFFPGGDDETSLPFDI